MSRIAKYEKLLAKFDEMKEILAATPEFSPDWDIQTRLNHVRERVKGRIVIEKGILPAKSAKEETKLPLVSREESAAELEKKTKAELLEVVAQINAEKPGMITGFEGAKKDLLVSAILSSLYPGTDGAPPAGAEIIK